MLCTRCQQREARGIPPERLAELERDLGGPLTMFRNDLCRECWGEWFREWIKSPEAKAETDRMQRFLREKWERKLRSGALKVLDFADDLVGKLS